MGNESSNANSNDNASSDNTLEGKGVSDSGKCDHGYEGPQYNHLNNDSLESTHIKNDYNDAVDRTLSFEPQSPATIHSAPSDISDACNNCKN